MCGMQRHAYVCMLLLSVGAVVRECTISDGRTDGRTDGRKEGQTEETYQFTIELLQLLGSGGRAELRRAEPTNVN